MNNLLKKIQIILIKVSLTNSLYRVPPPILSYFHVINNPKKHY